MQLATKQVKTLAGHLLNDVQQVIEINNKDGVKAFNVLNKHSGTEIVNFAISKPNMPLLFDKRS